MQFIPFDRANLRYCGEKKKLRKKTKGLVQMWSFDSPDEGVTIKVGSLAVS